VTRTRDSTPSASWAERRADIRHRFERLVGGYDQANRFISLGLDGGWRRNAVREGLRALRDFPSSPEDSREGLWVDLASGTGAMARAMTRLDVRRVVRLDLSPILLDEEHALPGTPSSPRVVAESHLIPLSDNCASALTMGFATRHLPSLEEFGGECARVLKPGGVLVLLDMDLGRGLIWGPFYRFYFRHVLPRLAGFVTRQRDNYRWMVRTVEEGPRPETILPALEGAGFRRIRVRHLTGGAVYLIVANL
jgi:demethylmenaquinone methyltransferase/2-methoxy-6-polyprenyl-1,4-benzoquinol methylase